MENNQVAILLEEIRSQFRTFGEGLQLVNDKSDRVEQKVDHIEEGLQGLRNEVISLKAENRQEHQQLRQMISELDTEVIQLKRVK